jgi:hypothetical protein
MNGRWFILMIGITALRMASASAEPAPDGKLIGIEGNVEITLGRADYQPKPLDDRTPLILRVEAVRPAGDGLFAYDFHYIGFEPGNYKLADYLMRPDGSPAIELGDQEVHVDSVLPPDHDGALNAYLKRPFPWFGGYRMMLGGLAVLWVLGLLAFVWFNRRRKPVVAVEPVVPPPSYAERMRPLVEAAAAGELSATGQAELERLMTGYWREKSGLPGQRMVSALSALKKHPEAGTLLLAMERWLHRPGGAGRAEIEELLEPYRHLPAEPGMEVKP